MALVKDLKTISFEADFIELLKKYNYIGLDNFPFEVVLHVTNNALPLIKVSALLGEIEDDSESYEDF